MINKYTRATTPFGIAHRQSELKSLSASRYRQCLQATGYGELRELSEAPRLILGANTSHPSHENCHIKENFSDEQTFHRSPRLSNHNSVTSHAKHRRHFQHLTSPYISLSSLPRQSYLHQFCPIPGSHPANHHQYRVYTDKSAPRSTSLTTRHCQNRSIGTQSKPYRSIQCVISLVSHNRDLSTTALVNDLMSSDTKPELDTSSAEPAQHKPLVVGLKKPANTNTMSSTTGQTPEQALNKDIQENVAENTAAAAPADKPTKKKEKAPKQPKPPKPAAVVAPTSPALIDLRVGHILRAIPHPDADKLYVSTIAMGDPEGTEHTQVDEATGKVVRTVCSGLKAYIPLEDMQDRKIVVVANLKPVKMRNIQSAAMVLAASPKPEEGADAHAPDRTVELVVPPESSEAGDKVYFEGWPYGEGKGPEKQLNPKKKQWEAVQPGFYTSEDLKVGFDASVCEEVTGSEKGLLIVEGKGHCTVPTLKGAVVR